SLKSKLSIYFVMVAVLCVTLTSIMANIFMEKQFRQYTRINQEQKNKDFVDLISHQYLENKWDMNSIEEIGMNALKQGLILRITGNSGQVIWDAAKHNNGLCKQMMDELAKSTASHYPDWDGKISTSQYPVYNGNFKVASVSIGFYGPFYYSDNDLIFIRTLNKIIIAVGLISLVFAFALGIFISHRLQSPIRNVIKTTKSIVNGYYDVRITESTSINEIFQLTTEINNLARALEKQENIRKRLTADVAHELRTPMATLQSHLEAMIDGIWKMDILRLECCRKETIRLGKLIESLEELERYEGDSVKLTRECYDISEQINSVLYGFEAAFTSKGINVLYDGNSGDVFADRDKISQVLINLISNALKYTSHGGSLEVRVNQVKKETSVSIRDTGAGISKDDLPLIFERFFRADKSRNRATGGAGIGLTIVKTIVEAHKGRITVKSELGKGSEFVFFLPATA
ncbi:MAG TPA: ATP-binding protein, partial [Clostridia bacterium]